MAAAVIRALAVAAALACALGAQRRPNIVVIMADDLGYECLTCNGGQSYETPNLDKLAAGGARFTSAHVQPLCTPTRVQVMTGQYNVRTYAPGGEAAQRGDAIDASISDRPTVVGGCRQIAASPQSWAGSWSDFDRACQGWPGGR